MSLTSTLTPAQILAAFRPPTRFQKASFTGQAAGSFHSSLLLAGIPGAGTAASAGLNGAALTGGSRPNGGAIPFPAAVGGQSVYLGGVSAQEGGAIGGLIVADRLWENSGYTVTSTGSQATAFPGLPARDSNGAASGVGVELWVEIYTATTNGAPVTLTISYTNSAGTATHTATATIPANAVAGLIIPATLQAGDVGVQSIQSATLSASLVTGSFGLVCTRSITDIPITADNLATRQDIFQLGSPLMYDGSVPWLIYEMTGTGGGRVTSSLSFLQV